MQSEQRRLLMLGGTCIYISKFGSEQGPKEAVWLNLVSLPVEVPKMTRVVLVWDTCRAEC